MATLPICYGRESSTHPFPGSKPGRPRALWWTRVLTCVPHPVPWLPETFIKVTLHTCGLTDVPKADLISGCVHLRTFTHMVVSPSILFIELGRGSLERALSALNPALLGAITMIWCLDSVSWASVEEEPRNVF